MNRAEEELYEFATASAMVRRAWRVGLAVAPEALVAGSMKLIDAIDSHSNISQMTEDITKAANMVLELCYDGLVATLPDNHKSIRQHDGTIKDKYHQLCEAIVAVAAGTEHEATIARII